MSKQKIIPLILDETSLDEESFPLFFRDISYLSYKDKEWIERLLRLFPGRRR